MWMFAIIVPTLCFIHGVLSNSPPAFLTPGPFSIPEDKPIGSTLFNLSASDPDGGYTLHFGIESTVTDDLVRFGSSFQPDGNTKSRPINLRKALDRDYEPGLRNLVFSVNDGQYTVTATILVIITDVNDEPPKFDEPGYRVSVKESETVGNNVSKVSASDPDTGSGGQVYYGLKARGQNADEYRYTFKVDKFTGTILLNESLDYEDRTFYQYNATAWDDNPDEEHAGNKAEPVDFFVTVLDVQDTPPFFRNQPYIHTIDENVTVGTSVLKVLASDGDLGVSNQLEYYFLQGDSDSGSFSIDPNNGAITTRVLLDADSDEMKQKGGILSFHVNASEVFPPGQEQLGETSSSTQVTITIRDVNDNSPNFTSNIIQAEVFENTPIGVPLTLRHPVEVEDIDMTSTNNLFELFVEKNGALYYDFDTVPGKNQPVSRSNIMIRVNNTDLLDYEERTNVTFQIVAKESQSFEKLSGSVSVVVNIINVNDNSPVFENDTYTFSISENASISDVVGQVQAHDADVGTFGEVSYHLEDLDTDFNISVTNGSITVSKDLDRERRSSYSLLVLAYDNDANSPRTGQTRVDIHINDINDNAPEFVGNTLTIPLVEDAANDTIVTTVTATDPDEGSNAEIEYFIKDDHNVSGRFAVNTTTGVVTVAAPLVSFTGLRYIVMEAKDKGNPPLSGNQTLVFSIRDVNLHSPKFTNPAGEFNPVNRSVVEVFEERPLGDGIFVYKATDDDIGNNGKVYYSIEPGHDSEKFRIDHEYGNLTNSARLDRETQSEYQIQIIARDGGSPSLQATLPVTVKLLDIDDNEPFFPDSLNYPNRVLTIGVPEETVKCMDGVHVNYSVDADEWENNTRRCYYIQGGDQPDTQAIHINKTTGDVCLIGRLDREERPLVNMLVKVSRNCTLTGSPDQAFNSKFNRSDLSILHVKVEVDDINDNPPVFIDNGKLQLGILYDTAVGEVIHNLRDDVSDADEGIHAITYFRDLGQTGTDIDDVGKSAFSVSNNGSVTSNRLFSSTMLGYVEIAVEAYDIGNLTARASLKIYIISNIQRVKIIFNKEADEVRLIKNDFVRELEEYLDYKIIVEKIASHQLADKSTVDTRTDMFIHAEYPEGGLVPASELWKAFDFTRGIAVVFAKYGVTETKPVVGDVEPDDELSRQLMMGLILVAVILTIIALSLAISLYCIRQKYARRLRAERTGVTYVEKEPPPPGTNLYTSASNPVYMKEDVIKEEDEGSIDLDDNAVDYAEVRDVLDEQEMTIEIDSPDALRTMARNSVLDDVLNKYAEIEKEKLKDDKQSLVEEQGSDGDSGFYGPMKALEHSDI